MPEPGAHRYQLGSGSRSWPSRTPGRGGAGDSYGNHFVPWRLRHVLARWAGVATVTRAGQLLRIDRLTWSRLREDSTALAESFCARWVIFSEGGRSGLAALHRAAAAQPGHG